MLKAAYFANPDVAQFVTWLSETLASDAPNHTYVVAGDAVPIVFNGLSTALIQYRWPFSFVAPGADVVTTGSSYSDSVTALNCLRAGLVAALASTSDRATRDWAKAVMKWGGVTNGNSKWLDSNCAGLAAHVNSTQALLVQHDDAMKGRITRFNAGMTKIYSLIVEDFVMYDSRVAAALAWFVAKWCHETEKAVVPTPLCFRCLRPKEAPGARTRKLRNPSCSHYRFPWINTPTQHAHWNQRASWVLSAVLAAVRDTSFHLQPTSSRALEAAFFMWGYDLGASPLCSSGGSLK